MRSLRHFLSLNPHSQAPAWERFADPVCAGGGLRSLFHSIETRSYEAFPSESLGTRGG